MTSFHLSISSNPFASLPSRNSHSLSSLPISLPLLSYSPVQLNSSDLLHHFPLQSSKFASFLWSPNHLLIPLAPLFTFFFFISNLPSFSHPCSSQPHSFPLAESPFISIWPPSAREKMKIDSPSSNCFSLVKEKGKAVSWALSKAIHPSPFKSWWQACSQIRKAPTETGEKWVIGGTEAAEGRKLYGKITYLWKK